MFFRASQPIFRDAFMTFAAIMAATVIASSPALAIDGRTAVGVCIDSTATRCAWSVNDKGEIDICNQSGCVFCRQRLTSVRWQEVDPARSGLCLLTQVSRRQWAHLKLRHAASISVLRVHAANKVSSRGLRARRRCDFLR